MVSHGNITHATLGMMVHIMEMDKIQEVCVSIRRYFLVIPILRQPPVWDTPEGLQVNLCVLPIYHSYGLYVTSFYNFLKRSTTVMLPKWDIDLFFDSIPK